MMEVTSAVKPSSGSAFSIDSIMSKDRDCSISAAAAAGSPSATSRRISVDRTLGLVSIDTHGPSATVSTSCACPISPELLAATASHRGHHHLPHHGGHHSPSSTIAEGHHNLNPGLSHLPSPPRGNGLHSSLPLSATEAAIMHNNRAAAMVAAAQSAQTLHSQAAMASLSAFDPHGPAAAFAGGVGTIPTLPSFSSLSHNNDRGLAALQALSHKMQGLPPSLGLPGSANFMAHHPGALSNGLGNGLGAGLAGLTPKHMLPLYSWFSRPGSYWAHRLPGSEPSFLLPFRKPKRIRTAFNPSQLLRLEHAFEKNHYVVGQERKDLAASLNLTETQVKVWFQNRRTKYKRVKAEEEGLPIPDDIDVDDEPDSEPEDN